MVGPELSILLSESIGVPVIPGERESPARVKYPAAVASRMYDNLLLPTDGSDAMQGVIEHAVELAAEHDARLHTLYVANTASLSDLPADAGWENITESLHQEGENALARVTDYAEGYSVTVETEVREGAPAKEVIQYADHHDCDIVVMGTHGRSGVDRLLLGSVAEKVVRSSTVPVLTIRVSAE
jgi:nucleotide-binding universal stress UspA family protein